LPALAVRAAQDFNFTLNCTQIGGYVLTAQGYKDNTSVENFTSTPNIGCNQDTCPVTNSFTFTKPSDPRYEKLRNIEFFINYTWEDQNVTIGQAFVNITDDDDAAKLVWQNYTLGAASNTIWVNHTLDPEEQDKFQKATRDITVNSFTSATNTPKGNVTVQTINYTWDNGKIFTEPQDLFIKVKVYQYNPLLTDAVLYINASNSTILGGWGETFNFSVQAQDRFGRNVTVTALHKKTGESFTKIGNDTCINCADKTVMNFTFDYNGSDVAETNAWTFIFNASNLDGNFSLPGIDYTVEQDDVNATIVGPLPNAIVNRSNSTIFSVSVFDSDNGTYLFEASQGKGEVRVTISGTTSFETTVSSIDADTGYINRTFNSTGGGGATAWCDDLTSYFLGLHAWKGGIIDGADTYVKENITTPINFTLVGQLTNTMILPNETVNFTRGQTIPFEGITKNDCNTEITEDVTIVFSMTKGTFFRNCTATSAGTCTIDTDINFPTGLYNITMESNLTGYYNQTTQNTSLFFLGTIAQLQNPRTTPNQTLIPWGQGTINFSINVSNNDNNTINVTLFIKNSSTEFVPENNTFCTNCSNNSLFVFTTQKNFTPIDITRNPWDYKWNSTDSGNVGSNNTITQSFNITANNINFSEIGGDNSQVNRSNENINNEVNLSALIYDMVLQRNTLNQSTPNLTTDMINISVYNGSIFECTRWIKCSVVCLGVVYYFLTFVGFEYASVVYADVDHVCG